MAGDGIVQSGQEYVSTESDSISTSYWLRTGWSYIVFVETIYYSEQLKVSMCIQVMVVLYIIILT